MHISQYIYYLTLVIFVCSQRIGEGEEIHDPKQYPFFAMFIYANPYERTKSKYLTCGSSLIHPEWILTAGHCLPTDKSKFDEMIHREHNVIFMGSVYRPNISNPREGRKIIDIQRHPDYIYETGQNGFTKTLRNDIAILKLNEPFTLSDTIDVIQLSTSSNKCEKGLAIGIGNPNLKNPHLVSNILKHGRMYLRNISSYLSNTLFCASSKIDDFIPSGYALSGDSGGPFICKNASYEMQIGVISLYMIGGVVIINWMEGVDFYIDFIKQYVPLNEDLRKYREKKRNISGKTSLDNNLSVLYFIVYLYCFIKNY